MSKDIAGRVGELTEVIELLSERFKQTETVFADRLELSERELALLYALGREGPVIPSQLAGRFGVPLSTMTGLVDRMEKKGLVRRVRDRRDRRSIELEATPAGALALREHRRLLEVMARGMLDALSDRDQKALVALLRRVRSALTAETGRRTA